MATDSSVQSTGQRQSDSCQKRKGKWTVEEEEYASCIIDYFEQGLLELPDGTTLRSYLSKKLGCHPMRITKKFTGTLRIGKKTYKCAEDSHRTTRMRTNAAKKIEAMESEFLRGVHKKRRCVSLNPAFNPSLPNERVGSGGGPISQAQPVSQGKPQLSPAAINHLQISSPHAPPSALHRRPHQNRAASDSGRVSIPLAAQPFALSSMMRLDPPIQGRSNKMNSRTPANGLNGGAKVGLVSSVGVKQPHTHHEQELHQQKMHHEQQRQLLIQIHRQEGQDLRRRQEMEGVNLRRRQEHEQQQAACDGIHFEPRQQQQNQQFVSKPSAWLKTEDLPPPQSIEKQHGPELKKSRGDDCDWLDERLPPSGLLPPPSSSDFPNPVKFSSKRADNATVCASGISSSPSNYLEDLPGEPSNLLSKSNQDFEKGGQGEHSSFLDDESDGVSDARARENARAERDSGPIKQDQARGFTNRAAKPSSSSSWPLDVEKENATTPNAPTSTDLRRESPLFYLESVDNDDTITNAVLDLYKKQIIASFDHYNFFFDSATAKPQDGESSGGPEGSRKSGTVFVDSIEAVSTRADWA